MDNEKLIEELHALREAVKILTWSVCALGALQNLRGQAGSQSEEPAQLNLESPEGRKLALDALTGFLSLAKFGMDEYSKPDSTFPIPPSWKM